MIWSRTRFLLEIPADLHHKSIPVALSKSRVRFFSCQNLLTYVRIYRSLPGYRFWSCFPLMFYSRFYTAAPHSAPNRYYLLFSQGSSHNGHLLFSSFTPNSQSFTRGPRHLLGRPINPSHMTISDQSNSWNQYHAQCHSPPHYLMRLFILWFAPFSKFQQTFDKNSPRLSFEFGPLLLSPHLTPVNYNSLHKDVVNSSFILLENTQVSENPIQHRNYSPAQ